MFNHPTRFLTLLAICLAMLLAACAPAALPTSTTLPPDRTQPATTTEPPTPTSIPAPSGELSPSELKYRLLAEFPDIFFCDRDFYPVPVGDELEMALQRFPELKPILKSSTQSWRISTRRAWRPSATSRNCSFTEHKILRIQFEPAARLPVASQVLIQPGTSYLASRSAA
jgi:hypothetical protein